MYKRNGSKLRVGLELLTLAESENSKIEISAKFIEKLSYS